MRYNLNIQHEGVFLHNFIYLKIFSESRTRLVFFRNCSLFKQFTCILLYTLYISILFFLLLHRYEFEEYQQKLFLMRQGEIVTSLETMIASENLLPAAKIHRDHRVSLAIEWQDLVATEIKYHRSCYREYARKRNLENLARNNVEEEST